MLCKRTLMLLMVLIATFASSTFSAQEIPLPEHPRPDFERPDWINLNGSWEFTFDSLDMGITDEWYGAGADFPGRITVPFPWGSELSGQSDLADIAWYRRDINIPRSWQTKSTFLTVGASDWETTVWLDGQLVGKHQGGYVPFSFELTDLITHGQNHRLVVRVDDARRDFTLYGKQGYGNARGIWQTPYLEARGYVYLDALHFLPDIDKKEVVVKGYLAEPAGEDHELTISINSGVDIIEARAEFKAGSNYTRIAVPIPGARLWTLEDPHLYWVQAQLGSDHLTSYFGMRKISTMRMPNSEHMYVSLNNEPVYLQLALDQSYHPEGYYTFPSDKFLQEEIARSINIGLNGIRTHIKVEVPRKLYWADKLGLLVMEDLPNSWGLPNRKMQEESEYTMREMIKRDFNHPSIFSWCIFNETWGLKSDWRIDQRRTSDYLPETQDWVASMYYLAKSLDQTRLVEDNSICCGYGHTETDLNTWHSYLPGWAWPELLQTIVDSTFPGSTYDFENGFEQGHQPNFNSECGNVWGYEGSTGDVDWSWDYHRMLNTFRMFPKVAGWLYTEHHDVINEWNGYWRFDRSKKYTGFEELYPGMRLNDLHSLIYLSTGNEICKTVQGGAEVTVPIFLSAMTGADLGSELTIKYELEHTNYIGETEKNISSSKIISYIPWMQSELDPLKIKMPNQSGLSILRLQVEDSGGEVLHRNFMHFEVSGQGLDDVIAVSKSPSQYTKSEWSNKSWQVRDGRKVNGAGSGSFTYSFALPPEARRAKSGYFIVEASAKELFVKDQEDFDRDQDYMRGDRVSPSSNPNSYPMTDEIEHSSRISVHVNGIKLHTTDLADDPADHRGVLSWHHQLTDRKLREAGSYGYLIRVPLSQRILRAAARSGELNIELVAEGNGGLAIYGREFGQFPFDPSVVLKMN